VELFAMPVGTCTCAHSVVTPGYKDDEFFSIPVSSYLVRLDNGELLLVDTGMSVGHIENPELTWGGTPFSEVLTPVMAAADSIEHQLAVVGVTPDDIAHVINTHLHFDHAGNNFLFRNATFYAQRDHYEFAQGNPSFPNEYWNLPGLQFQLLDGATELFPGVEIIPTPGHAPGHQSVLVRLPETGSVIICGDAVYLRDNYDLDNWNGHGDPEAARASAQLLKQRAEAENATLLFGHDPAQYEQFDRSPHVHH
jgi:N-acyl homoserine lactone hydrolase